MEKRKDILNNKKQCRFCLADQFVELQSLYYRNRQSRNAVTLPMKILSSVSMEVFPSDKMLTYICRRCSFFMDVCYEFKQVCRLADESIFKFIQSGTALEPVVWPPLLSRAFKNGTKKPSGLKTTVEDGTKVEVTPHYMSESEEDNENVYNVKIEHGEDEESARIKVVTGNNDTKKKSKTRKKDDEDDVGESGGGGDDSFVEGCWACDECECAYPLQQLLELHKMQKHRARNFPCDQCDSKFFSSNDLSAHKMCHSNELPFQCAACGKKFRRLNLLKRHEKTVHADQPQKPCPRCPATFLTDMEKEDHLLSHSKEADRQYSCEDCDKKFSLQTSLQKHVSAVHGEKKWTCQYCPLRFSSATNLTKHVRTHAGERQYPCKYCDKSFVKSHHYTRHVRVKHQDLGGRPEQYRCEQCEDMFATQDELIYHSAIHATQNLTCPLCQEKFRDVDAVTAHIKSHVTEEEFMCDFCELVFTCKEKLDMHTAAAHDDEVQNNMEFEENESSMDMDAEPEAEEDDPAFNIKEEGGEFLLELKKPEEFMLSNSRHEVEERGDNTYSEESEAEANYTEMATLGSLAMEKPGPMPPLVPAPAFTVAAAAPAFTVAAVAPAFTVAAAAPAFTVAAAAPAFTVAAAAPAFTVAAAAPAFTVAAAAPAFTVGPAAPATPTPVLARPDGHQSPVKIVVGAQNVIRKAEIVKRKIIQQPSRVIVQAKKDKPVSKVENNNSVVGASDKSLRLLEKELQELKRTTSRNEILKTPAKTAESFKTNRRPQLHTSTPKPRLPPTPTTTNNKGTEKKLPDRRTTRENKDAKEIKDTKTKDDSKDTRTKDDSKAKQDEKEKDLKEPETPKNAISNGDKSTPDEGPVRRSTRPSKVKDYAKMVRDRSQEASDDDDSDDGDEEYVDEEKNESQRARRGSIRPVAKPTPAKTGLPRKRGRPRKDAVKEEPEVAPKMRKDQSVEEHKSEKQDETEDVKSKEDIKIQAKDLVAKENDENKGSDENKASVENVNTGAEKKVVDSPKKVDMLVSPTGATLKKVGTLPPGIKALPLPKPRVMGPGELCEMQIGKKVVKVQKIVMTKAEVEEMAKKGLLEMKDGTMVLKQGIKLPAKEPVAFKSSLVGEEANKESPIKKSAPTRVDFDDET